MADAFIYDTVRTPRGRGKADGSLHEVTALNLATQALGAIKDRNKLKSMQYKASEHIAEEKSDGRRRVWWLPRVGR